MKFITVAVAVNDSYLLPTIVMMRSLVQSLSADVKVKFYLLTTGLRFEAIRIIENNLFDINLNYEEVIVDVSLLYGLKTGHHITIEAYFRILIPYYINNTESVLYLDTDTIVRRSVDEIFDEKFEGAHLIAVPHASRQSAYFCSEKGVPSYSVLGIPGMTRTFNAGVMLLNIEAWKRDNVTQSILKYLRDYHEQVL